MTSRAVEPTPEQVEAVARQVYELARSTYARKAPPWDSVECDESSRAMIMREVRVAIVAWEKVRGG